jgi:hypothetical protein
VHEEILTNPAGRLAAILRSVASRPASESARTAWALALGTDEGDVLLLLSRCADVVGLVHATREAIERLPAAEEPAFHLKHFDAIEQAVGKLAAVGGGMHVQHFTPLIRPEVIGSLDWTARVLRRLGLDERALDTEKVPELVEQIRRIIDEVAADEGLPSDVRMLLVSRLREVESALLNIRITGYARVEETLDALSFVPVRSDLDQAGKERAWKKIGQVWGLVQSGLTVAAAIAAPAAKILAILHSGGADGGS